MKLKERAFVLLAALVAAHISVLSYASVACIQGWLDNNDDVSCKTMGEAWSRTTESYVAVILALLVPTVDRDGS